tara:strand:- start:8404 stop:8904 length:501 start_codon:yes stop_codon:yes gene_type:complete
VDPLTILAAANTAFTVVKKVAKAADEADAVYQSLSKWAGHISDLQEWMSQEEAKPSIFKKIAYNKSATAEAFDTLVAKRKIEEQEKEIKSMFYIGALNHLGIKGYKEFIHQRRAIKKKREKEVYEQIRRRKAFFYNTMMGSAITIIGTILISMVWYLIDMIKEVSS